MEAKPTLQHFHNTCQWNWHIIRSKTGVSSKNLQLHLPGRKLTNHRTPIHSQAFLVWECFSLEIPCSVWSSVLNQPGLVVVDVVMLTLLPVMLNVKLNAQNEKLWALFWKYCCCYDFYSGRIWLFNGLLHSLVYKRLNFYPWNEFRFKFLLHYVQIEVMKLMKPNHDFVST